MHWYCRTFESKLKMGVSCPLYFIRWIVSAALQHELLIVFVFCSNGNIRLFLQRATMKICNIVSNASNGNRAYAAIDLPKMALSWAAPETIFRIQDKWNFHLSWTPSLFGIQCIDVWLTWHYSRIWNWQLFRLHFSEIKINKYHW